MSKYAVSEKTTQQIDMAFVSKGVKDDQPARYLALREAGHQLALLIASETPPSREQALALTNLEQAVMWANAAIARNE